MAKVIVTGSRNYTDAAHVVRVMSAELQRDPDLHVVVGYDPNSNRYQGLDQLVYRWCIWNRVPGTCFPADWRKYGNGAGPKRNRLMARSGARRCLVWPGGRGTTNMYLQAIENGIEPEFTYEGGKHVLD